MTRVKDDDWDTAEVPDGEEEPQTAEFLLAVFEKILDELTRFARLSDKAIDSASRIREYTRELCSCRDVLDMLLRERGMETILIVLRHAQRAEAARRITAMLAESVAEEGIPLSLEPKGAGGDLVSRGRVVPLSGREYKLVLTLVERGPGCKTTLEQIAAALGGITISNVASIKRRVIQKLTDTGDPVLPYLIRTEPGAYLSNGYIVSPA